MNEAARILELIERETGEAEVSKSRFHAGSELSILNVLTRHVHGLDPSIQKRIRNEIVGHGPLDVLLDDESITEILILDFQHISFEKEGKLFSLPDTFLSVSSYSRFLCRLYDAVECEPTIAHPFVSGRWGAFRVQISLKGICTDQTQVTLRRISAQPWTSEKLLDLGWCLPSQMEFLSTSVKSHKNILVVGPTGSGKTAVLNALLNEVESNERILILEDTDELRLPNSHSTKMLTRTDTRKILPEINLHDLVKQSLRMRPDRLVVGEVRGEEAGSLLMALSTGHKGAVFTMHARSAKEALLRLEMLVQMGAPQWSFDSIRRLVFFSIDLIVVVEKDEKGKRVLKSIDQLSSIEPTGITLTRI
jgi:pilus assembly protein CpaF